MSESSRVKSKTPLLGDRSYNTLKQTATIVLPALATLYFALAQLWHFPEPEKVVATITALNTFVGIVVGISKRNYDGGGKYVGEIQVTDTGEKVTYSLVTNGDPEKLAYMDEATFKVNTDISGYPEIKQ